MLKYTDSPTVDIRRQLRLVNGNYVEMKALDESIWEEIDDDEFDADLAVSYEFDAEVAEIRTRVDFERLSAVLSHIAAQSHVAPNPDFAVIRHGKSTALSCEGKMTAEADNLQDVHPACERCSSELRALTAGEDPARPGLSSPGPTGGAQQPNEQ